MDKTIPINLFRVVGLRRFVYLAPRNPPIMAEGPNNYVKKINFIANNMTN